MMPRDIDARTYPRWEPDGRALSYVETVGGVSNIWRRPLGGSPATQLTSIEFVWNRHNARTDLVKHRVSFEEAQTVFLDENARLIDDPDHSEEEDRFVLLGYSYQARCLIVSHCYRERGSVSARSPFAWIPRR